MKWVTLAAVVGAVFVALVAAVAWLTVEYPKRPGPGEGKVVEVELPAGTSARQLASQLAGKGVISDPYLWELYLRLIGADRKLRVGIVLLRDNMTMRQVVRRVASGEGAVEVKVTIPEGYSRFEIAELFERWNLCRSGDFIRATENSRLLYELGIEAASAEGYLFPDTYRFIDNSGAETLVRRLVGVWRQRVPRLLGEYPAALAELHRQLGWGVHQVIILASIVEKETALAEERPMIAGVYLNRLLKPDFRPRRLQADPTVAYGCLVAPAGLASCAGYRNKQITHLMLQDSGNPYNTYRIEGLPPGPISNPGLPSIRAVLAPARHDFLYFVAGRGGQHRFSATIDAHNLAVKSAQSEEGR